MKRLSSVVVLAVAVWSGAAMAQRTDTAYVGSRGQSWSVLSGRMLNSGDALHLQLGWPGLSATYLHSVSPKFDAGARFTFNYGYEGVTTVNAGLKLQALAKINLVDTGRLAAALTFSPGAFVYFTGGTVFGITMPVGVVLGIPVGDAITLNFGMDAPFNVRFVGGGQFDLHLLFGGGLEYAIDRNLMLTLNTRFGPAINFNSGSGQFAFDALMGVAFKL